MKAIGPRRRRPGLGPAVSVAGDTGAVDAVGRAAGPEACRVAARECHKANRRNRSSPFVHHRHRRQIHPRAPLVFRSPGVRSGDCSGGTAPAPRRSRDNSARRVDSSSPPQSDHRKSARPSQAGHIFPQCGMDCREFSHPDHWIRIPGPSDCDSCGGCCARASVYSDRFS